MIYFDLDSHLLPYSILEKIVMKNIETGDGGDQNHRGAMLRKPHK